VPQEDVARRVLVVEDDATVRDLLQDLLERQGFAVSTAESGEAALSTLASQRPHIVLLDLALSGLSGWDVLEQMRTEGAGPADPSVLLLSASPDLEATALAYGTAGALAKPFEPATLLALLERLVPPVRNERAASDQLS
jgi:DNA-binding response OmpR family regulator